MVLLIWVAVITNSTQYAHAGYPDQVRNCLINFRQSTHYFTGGRIQPTAGLGVVIVGQYGGREVLYNIDPQGRVSTLGTPRIPEGYVFVDEIEPRTLYYQPGSSSGQDVPVTDQFYYRVQGGRITDIYADRDVPLNRRFLPDGGAAGRAVAAAARERGHVQPTIARRVESGVEHHREFREEIATAVEAHFNDQLSKMASVPPDRRSGMIDGFLRGIQTCRSLRGSIGRAAERAIQRAEQLRNQPAPPTGGPGMPQSGAGGSAGSAT